MSAPNHIDMPTSLPVLNPNGMVYPEHWDLRRPALPIEQINELVFNHKLSCGHVIRSSETPCARNCALKAPSQRTQMAMAFACYECGGKIQGRRIVQGRLRKSIPGDEAIIAAQPQSERHVVTACSHSGIKYLRQMPGGPQTFRVLNDDGVSPMVLEQETEMLAEVEAEETEEEAEAGETEDEEVEDDLVDELEEEMEDDLVDELEEEMDETMEDEEADEDEDEDEDEEESKTETSDADLADGVDPEAAPTQADPSAQHGDLPDPSYSAFTDPGVLPSHFMEGEVNLGLLGDEMDMDVGRGLQGISSEGA